MEFREIIASRLSREFKRRGLQPNPVAEAYIRARREINLQELFDICQANYINFYRLISKHYESATNLQFRNLRPEGLKIAAEAEDVFLIIKDFLPEANIPQVPKPPHEFSDPQGLIASLPKIIDDVKSKYGDTVEEIIQKLKLTILSIREGKQFDGFFLNCDPHYAIGVNSATPSSRIHFSLLHELAHFLFDPQREIEVDALPINLYKEHFDEHERPEFIATKFAQFFLIPFDSAESLCRGWPSLNLDAAQEIINRNRTSVDVLINAIYDIEKIKSGGRLISYNAVKGVILPLKSCDDPSVIRFLDKKRGEIASILKEHATAFSFSVLSEIDRIIGVECETL